MRKHKIRSRWGTAWAGICLALLWICFLAVSVQAQTHTYSLPNGNWGDQEAWVEGSVPGANDTANVEWSMRLGYTGSGTAFIPASYTVGTLNFDAPNSWGPDGSIFMYNQTLTINNGGSWVTGHFEGYYGAGQVNVNGVLNLSGIFNSSGNDISAHGLENSTVLVNDGTMNQIGKIALSVGGSGSVTNNGTYDLQGDGDIVSQGQATTHFYNNGVLKKTSGNSSRVGLWTVNSGAVEVDSGLLYLSTTDHIKSGALEGGRWKVGENSTLRMTPFENNIYITANKADVELSGQNSVLSTTKSNTYTSLDDTLAENQGKLTISNGRNFTAAGHFTNSGTLTIGGNSTFKVNPGYQFTQTATGIINGTGTFDGSLVNAGMVSPGNSPGTLLITGDYTQSITGVFDVEIAGLSDYDVLDISGSAQLDGDLQVSFLNGFTPDKGDVFDILWAASIDGAFNVSDEFRDLFAISYNNFDEQLGKSFVRLEYIFDEGGSGQNPVPEPASIILLGIGLLGLAGVTRRNHQ